MNCGFEYSCGPGVTMRLAPAHIRKEGAAFALPMALVTGGVEGKFYGQPLRPDGHPGEAIQYRTPDRPYWA